MKRIGLIGGLGPESTIDYYKELIYSFTRNDKSLSLPEIIIFSVNMSELLKMMENRDFENLVSWLLNKIDSLYKAGAEIAAITANTPHIVFDTIKAKSPVPLVSIVEATSAYAKNSGYKRLGLFGTGFTMKEKFFTEVFNRNGLHIVLPNREEQQYIHNKLFTEIELGIFKNETRAKLYEIAMDIKNRESIDSLILGCTELPLIMNDNNFNLDMLNTTKIHVQAILRESK